MNQLYYGHYNEPIEFEQLLRRVPEGWRNILENGFERMFAAGWDGKITQIKEKFGTLRLYRFGRNDEIDKIIQDMQKQTAKVCSVCGSPSTCVTEGWILHRCDEHREL